MIYASVHRHMFNLHIDHWFLSGEKVAEFWGLFYIKLYQLCVIAVHLIRRNTTICVLLNCSQKPQQCKTPLTTDVTLVCTFTHMHSTHTHAYLCTYVFDVQRHVITIPAQEAMTKFCIYGFSKRYLYLQKCAVVESSFSSQNKQMFVYTVNRG